MSQQQREFSLDRYVRNQLMAEGVTVHAQTEAEAREKARALYSDDPAVHETRFQLRSDPTSQAEPFKLDVERLNAAIEAFLDHAPATAVAATRANIEAALIKALRAYGALSASPAAGDWVMVPREPTEAMIEAHFAAHARAKTVFAEVPAIWAAMLAAAPQPPSGEREALEKEREQVNKLLVDGHFEYDRAEAAEKALREINEIAEKADKKLAGDFNSIAAGNRRLDLDRIAALSRLPEKEKAGRTEAAEDALREIHKLAVHRGTFASVDTRMEHAEHALTRIAALSCLPEERKP